MRVVMLRRRNGSDGETSPAAAIVRPGRTVI
jgi:hypothetical protein